MLKIFHKLVVSTGYTASEETGRYNGRKKATLENVLRPYSAYEFRIQAGNELGYGPPSMASPQYSTPADRPAKAPSNIRGGGGKFASSKNTIYKIENFHEITHL